MKVEFNSYEANEQIPVINFLKNKKLKKYFNRETEASIVGVAKLIEGVELNKETPLYFGLGKIEYEDYGLNIIIKCSLDESKIFSNKLFMENGLVNISPLNQFKVLQNMPLSFVSIEFNLTGDNAVVYSSASALLQQVINSSYEGQILLGASKAYCDGKVEAGFALVHKYEVVNSLFLSSNCEAVEMFKKWHTKGIIE